MLSFTAVLTEFQVLPGSLFSANKSRRKNKRGKKMMTSELKYSDLLRIKFKMR